MLKSGSDLDFDTSAVINLGGSLAAIGKDDVMAAISVSFGRGNVIILVVNLMAGSRAKYLNQCGYIRNCGTRLRGNHPSLEADSNQEKGVEASFGSPAFS
jgi:hypothetical protein